MSNFKNFLILEQNGLDQRIAPLVNAVDELKNDFEQMGNRQVIKSLTQLADEIRKIINDDWSDSDEPTLKTLQKLAFFILKSIDSSEDLKTIIDKTSNELYLISGQNNVQVNNLGTSS